MKHNSKNDIIIIDDASGLDINAFYKSLVRIMTMEEIEFYGLCMEVAEFVEHFSNMSLWSNLLYVAPLEVGWGYVFPLKNAFCISSDFKTACHAKGWTLEILGRAPSMRICLVVKKL